MNRAILEACLPLFAWLVGAFVLLRLVIALSGARWELSRLRTLHRSEAGGVQTLSFVLTLPLFIIIVLFIVQVSQLMIGVTVVNYAAFAAARSASVWIPARLTGAPAQTTIFANPLQYFDTRRENVMPRPFAPEGVEQQPPVDQPNLTETPIVLAYDSSSGQVAVYQSNAVGPGNPQYAPNDRRKIQKIFTAAVMACAAVCPSRDLQTQPLNNPLISAANTIYHALDPQASANSRISRRIQNKIGYGLQNTAVEIRFSMRHSIRGPKSYNPIGRGGINPPEWPYVPGEVGWNDPIQVTVGHNFALLPGPGRFLAKQILSQDPDYVDRVSPTITTDSSSNGEPIYRTMLIATATLTNEGFKSVRPYELP